MPEDNRNSFSYYKKNLITLVATILLLVVFVWYVSHSQRHVDMYSAYVFQPLQLLRNYFTHYIPFCLGDILYVGLALNLLWMLVRWLYYLFSLRDNHAKLGVSFLKFVTNVCLLCLLFMVGWGGNYYKQPLKEVWALDSGGRVDDSQLVVFDRFLVEKMNATSPHYRDYTFKKMERLSEMHYRQLTDCHAEARGLNVKHTLFGNMMQYVGVQGYYNPFTGEAQVNRNLPDFMLPFVISHEMAHQAGIGAEDDANLLAYAICIRSEDVSFQYSAYFNIWLYTHSRLKMRDSVLANDIKKTLNPLSLAHLDTLKAQRMRYRSAYSRYGADMYDQYLKLNNQKDGIESYGKVSLSAWVWEQMRIRRDEGRIHIP